MPLKNRRNQTSLAHTRSKSESRAINICLATNGGCPFSPLGVNVETVRTIFTIVPPAAPTSSTCFLTHNVISPVYARLRGVVGQVLPRKRGRHHVENWSVDTNLRPLFGHSPLFCLLDAHCDALFLFALKTVHRRNRSRAQGNIDSWRFCESRSWIGFSFHFKAVSLYSILVPKMVFCM